ncbi:MAG: hypothetical protein WA431_06680 [Candidatus Cybelea sp.]
MKTVNKETVNEELKNEVLATYAAYLRAFNANDIPSIDKLIQYPLAHIDNGRTNLVNTYPYKPADLMAAKQWHATIDPSCEVFASAEKAHVILRSANRVRADGSLIETVSVFYALTRTSSGWKFFAISVITELA